MVCILFLQQVGQDPAGRTQVLVLPHVSAGGGRHGVLSSLVWGTGITYILKNGIHSVEKDKSTSNRRCHTLKYQHERQRGPHGSRPNLRATG